MAIYGFACAITNFYDTSQQFELNPEIGAVDGRNYTSDFVLQDYRTVCRFLNLFRSVDDTGKARILDQINAEESIVKLKSINSRNDIQCPLQFERLFRPVDGS